MNTKPPGPQLSMALPPRFSDTPPYLEPHMGLSPEMRRLQNRWMNGGGWPKRLEYLEITGIRGWTGQRVDFRFPIVALVGENGAGKSTVIQCAASCYQEGRYPTEFLPDTPWETIKGASVNYAYRQGDSTQLHSLKKLKRWRGYDQRPHRTVEYIDLSRVQPVSTRTGYQRLANPQLSEEISKTEYWDDKLIARLSNLMGREYEGVRMAAVKDDKDPDRRVPVLKLAGQDQASGFHSGQGETTIAELITKPLQQTALVLIDEIETSLHPKVQRRVLRELATLSAANDLQIILTTHSPFILQELPPEARIYIMNGVGGRQIVSGVSPEFAMTRMDDIQHPECDVYVEDPRSAELVRTILVERRPDLFIRCLMIPYGAANVGYSLGSMVAENRFRRPSVVFVDGDQVARNGCHVLPGKEAPERVVFEGLRAANWEGLAAQLGRGFSDVADACLSAMPNTNHRDWIRQVGDRLLLGGDIIWHAMCVSWVKSCLTEADAEIIVRPIADALRA